MNAREVAGGVGSVAGAIGKGLAAGLAGTAAMTAAQHVEMMISGREASDAPAEAVGEVLGVEPRSEESEERLSQLTHWAYGTGWGAFRCLLGAAGIEGPRATLLHFGAVWGTALVMLPRLDLAPPLKEWGAAQIAKDGALHAIYALAVGQAYDRMNGEPFERSNSGGAGR